MEYKANSLTTRNNKVKYMFLSWEGFCNRFISSYNRPTVADYQLTY